MRHRVHALFAVSLLALLAAGCAPKAVVLSPGPIPVGGDLERVTGPSAWSVWVRAARDARAPEFKGQKLGTLYTRFEKKPQEAFLDQEPQDYVAAELRRYLLHRGLEASSESKARVLIDLDVLAFSLEETPGSVWDEITVKVAYTATLYKADGEELGRVKLESESQVKAPTNTESRVEEALREALADTFRALANSSVFRQAVP